MINTISASIHRETDSEEFYTDERCFILEIANDRHDEAVSIARARVEPKITTAWHKLENTVERYLIISGVGRVELGDLPAQSVATGDVVRIPAGVAQRITNTGESNLVFYAICTPRFEQKNYISLE